MEAPYLDYSAFLPPTPIRFVKSACEQSYWCGEAPTDTKPVLYFSGHCGQLYTEVSMPVCAGIVGRCVSYGYLSDKRVKLTESLWPLLEGKRMFLDSGAFTLQKQRATIEQVRAYAARYARYIRETESRWDWYAGLDYKRDCAIIRASHDELRKLGIRPTPVYHGDSSLDWLRRYCEEGHKFICIGRPPKHLSVNLDYFYSNVHEVAAKYGTKLHGFQETGKRMFRYPWWSCDSSSWLAGGRTGSIILWDEPTQVFLSIRMTDSGTKVGYDVRWNWPHVPPVIKNQVLGIAAAMNVSEETLIKQYYWRNCFNVYVMLKALTEWQHRKDNSNQLWKTLL